MVWKFWPKNSHNLDQSQIQTTLKFWIKLKIKNFGKLYPLYYLVSFLDRYDDLEISKSMCHIYVILDI